MNLFNEKYAFNQIWMKLGSPGCASNIQELNKMKEARENSYELKFSVNLFSIFLIFKNPQNIII